MRRRPRHASRKGVREFVALALIGLWAVYGAATQARTIWSELEGSRQRHALIAAHLTLFAQVRQDVAGEEAVGYVNASGGGPDYFLAQYALNPVLLFEDLRQARRVVAFFPAGIPPTLLSQQGLSPVRSYGNGLFLLEKRISP